MKLTMLGTGSAMASACYNTCFAISEGNQVFLVDGGGGNGIFAQLQKANIDWRDIQDIFVTHKHMDHILGVLWVIRQFCQSMASGKIDREVRVYGHREVIAMLQQMCDWMLVPEQIGFVGTKVRLIPVADGEHRQILGRDVRFFDIRSKKALQFGFSMDLGNGESLSCCGDEPLSEECAETVRGSKWLMLEAFCLYSQRDIFKPYEKHHSTVIDACRSAKALDIQNLLLYHTEDKNLACRKDMYIREGREHFTGNILVPDDLETIEL